MGFKDFLYKLNLKRLLVVDGMEKRKRDDERLENRKHATWMAPVSHGYHVVESSCDPANSSSPDDLVKVQREQVEEAEVWFFGIVDDRGLGDGLAKHLQSNLFDNKPKTSKLRRKSKEALKKAHISAREGILMTKDKERPVVSAASAIVITGEKLVLANMGGYRAVVCRDGQAYQLGSRRTWSGRLRLAKVRILAFDSSRNTTSERRATKSEVVVGEERIDSRTEFVILASQGIWEVMKNQEAVNLISHLEDPQEAAECLAKEALNRMSKTNISCIVIRFDSL
ncbi:putative protein phosphatase 2C-like protein 44 [Impatiens glandulifera]|uniref:putative protein phosphatase 2C-like protein 44 n=1 Tax=Impatiens glandulifera TaxID=253017 RepID=UPI001FB124D1|nr:putative protein phosphatase 2C-like protein 44 [Impatiens glandulifera]